MEKHVDTSTDMEMYKLFDGVVMDIWQLINIRSYFSYGSEHFFLPMTALTVVVYLIIYQEGQTTH